tara:strand:+ start:505 stop:1185 length:681 start_codon:yes stop_codon:yes gene_type:complete
MADGTTPNQGFTLPEVGASEDTWGTKINDNWTETDTLLGAVSATEIAILDGATVTTAQLNILAGATVTTAEINVLDGIPGTLTATEIGYVDGVTSAIQTQINAKITADVTGEFIADSYNETYVAVTSSGNATTVNCETGNTFSHTLTENTTFTFSNPPASGTGYSFTLKIVQDSTARTITWPASVDWAAATAPTISTGSGEVDVFVFFTTDGGTTFYGFTAGQVLS